MDEQYTYLGDGTGGIDYLAVPALALLGTLAVDKLCGTASDTTRMQQAVVAAIVALGVKLIADLLVRLIRTGPELRLGVVTALAGAPFFLWLLFKERRNLP